MKLESTGITHIYSTGVPMAKPDAVQYDKDGNEMAHWRFNPPAPKQEPEPEPITVEFREYLTRLNWQQGFERGWDEAVEKLTLTQEKLGYTAPLKKEWVGLDKEMMRNTTLDFNHGALWAERYLKEKNT